MLLCALVLALNAAAEAPAASASARNPASPAPSSASEPPSTRYDGTLTLDRPGHRLAAMLSVQPASCGERFVFGLNGALAIERVRVDGRLETPVPSSPPTGLPRNARGWTVSCGRRIEIAYGGSGPLTGDGRNQVTETLVELSRYGSWLPLVPGPVEWSLSVALPSDVVLVTNGTARRAGPTSAWELRSDRPASDVVLVAAPGLTPVEARVEGVQVRVLAPSVAASRWRARLERVARLVADAAALGIRELGSPTPGAGALDVRVVFSPRGGPLSYARLPLIVMPEARLSADDADEALPRTVLHEVAHFWSRASTDGVDDWLNEGLAELDAARWLRVLDPPALAPFLAQRRKTVADLPDAPPILTFPLDERFVLANRYARPLLALDALLASADEAASARFLRAVHPPPGATLTTVALEDAVLRELGPAAARRLGACLRTPAADDPCAPTPR